MPKNAYGRFQSKFSGKLLSLFLSRNRIKFDYERKEKLPDVGA